MSHATSANASPPDSAFAGPDDCPSTGDLLAQHGQIPLDAEAFAQQCLDSGRVSSADLIQLISLLPSETPARAPQSPNKQHPNQFSFTTGAYVRGGILGLRGNTLSFPLTTKVLTSYATNRVGDMPFTSVALFSDLEAPLHSDRNNAKGFDNFLIGISEFQGGELWIERHGGAAPVPLPHSHLLGVALPVSGQCVIFDAHLRHATMPWVGHRAVLAGFVIKGYEAISSSDHCALIKLGFNTPDLSTGDLVRHGDLASLERPRFVAPAVPVVFELFSGSGRVTACLRKLGLHAAHGIDHVVAPEAASSPLIADLTTEEGQQLALFWITNPLLSAVFAAPPCGTCSRAREIPLAHSKDLGPQPLRDHCTLTVSRPCKESVSNVLRLPTALMPSWPRLQPCATAEEFSSRVKTRIDPGSGTHPSFRASRIFALSGSLLIIVPLAAIAPSVPPLHPPWTVFLA